MNLSRCRETATYKLLIILDKHLHLLKNMLSAKDGAGGAHQTGSREYTAGR